MIKRRARAVGLEGAFAGHSLRAGFATEGYAQGTPEPAIMRHGRWRLGVGDAGLRRGRLPLERQRRRQAGAVAGAAVGTRTGILMLFSEPGSGHPEGAPFGPVNTPARPV